MAAALLGAAVLLAGVAYVGYGSLELTKPEVHSVVPALTDSPLKLLDAAAKLARGDVAGAAAAAFHGVEVRVSIGVQNRSLIPLYIPSVAHVLLLNGTAVIEPLESAAGWIRPGATLRQDLTVLVGFERLPAAAVAAVSGGGMIDVRVESKLDLLVAAWTLVSPVARFSLVESLRSVLPGL
ncbi:MAG: hypothetical protein IIC95_05950 [Chloroflexi bacterium]|nr:hypothetical protein [Chloroflexota bacterium]